MTMLTVTLKINYKTTHNYSWHDFNGNIRDFSFNLPTNRLIKAHMINKGLTTMATKQTTDTNEEVAIVELTLAQVLEMRLDEAVGPAIEEGLDADPTFYRPFEKKTEAELQFESEKCDAACVIAKMKQEKPDPQIEATRRDINREKRLRTA